MDDAFEKLKRDKKNSVDQLTNWIKQSKLIDDSKEAEDKVKQLFASAKDAQNVELEKFKEVVGKLAQEQNKTMDEFSKLLAEEGSKLVSALMAGASGFKDALTKK